MYGADAWDIRSAERLSTPAPGNKLIQLLADNNLTQQVHETTRQKNNILDLVISTEEELIVNLKITDKIGDHQAITFSIKIENGNIASEKNSYNFRRANFDAMWTELEYQTFEQPIVRNNAELGFEIFKNRVNDASRRHIPKRRATINNPSWINNDVKQALEGGREPMKQKKELTMNKLSQNTMKLKDKSKEL